MRKSGHNFLTRNGLSNIIWYLKKKGLTKMLRRFNDSSNDKTEEIVSNFLKQDSRFSLIRTEKNLGKGKALGIAQKIIDTELVVIHDADLEYFPEDLVEMYALANKHDNSLILGSRFIGTKKRKNIYKRTYIGKCRRT